MVIPSFTSVPDSLLSPAQVNQKFQSTSLAGLGDTCSFDELGNMTCVPDYTPAPPPDDLSGAMSELAAYESAHNTLPAPNADGTLSMNGQRLTYMDQSGNVIAPIVGGGYQVLGSNGSITKASGMPPAPSSGSMTAAQAQMYNSLIQGSLGIAKLLAVQPGTSLTAGGNITRQNPGYPVLGGTGGVMSGFAAGSSTTMLLLLGLGALVLFGMNKR